MSGIETMIRRSVAIAIALVTGTLVAGVARSHRRPAGRTTGAAERVLRPSVETAVGVALAGGVALAWRPLPFRLTAKTRLLLDGVGGLLAMSGLTLTLWGRLALGEFYAPSSVAGVRLHADHRLVTSGPFAIVRHPIYVGIQMTTFGSLLLFRTWATLLLWVSFIGLVARARQEDRVLRLEFGETWDAYRRRVPGWLPRPRPRSSGGRS